MSAVIDASDARSGEVIKAFIVSTNPVLSQTDVIAFCRQHLTAYKVPKQAEFRDELPTKVLRRTLRDEALIKQTHD